MIRAGHVALAAFVAALGTVGAVGLSTAVRAGRPVSGAWLDGSAEAAFMRDFEKAVPFKDAAIALFASTRYDLFGEGYQGVVVGKDGWLFSTEEFEPALSKREGFLPGPEETALVAARDALSARGIRLVVALVPSKSRVYADRLGGTRVPPAIEARYAGALGLLERLGIPAIDLQTAMSRARYDTGDGADPKREELFLRTDSHWTPAGAQTAARAVAETVRRLGVDLAPMRVEAADSTPLEREGDLMSYMPKRGTTRRPLPAIEILPGYETYVDSGAGLFGSPEIPVALVGTSYSADPAWHFEGFLKRELGTDVLNLSESGSGPFKPMDAALAADVLEASGVRLVVWEMPERYLRAGVDG